MTREEFMATHDGREPYDEKYWGPGGVDVAGRWGGKMHMSRGCSYAEAPGRKISTGRKARGYASGTDGRIVTS
jgi:hypothetical protein